MELCLIVSCFFWLIFKQRCQRHCLPSARKSAPGCRCYFAALPVVLTQPSVRARAPCRGFGAASVTLSALNTVPTSTGIAEPQMPVDREIDDRRSQAAENCTLMIHETDRGGAHLGWEPFGQVGRIQDVHAAAERALQRDNHRVISCQQRYDRNSQQ